MRPLWVWRRLLFRGGVGSKASVEDIGSWMPGEEVRVRTGREGLLLSVRCVDLPSMLSGVWSGVAVLAPIPGLFFAIPGMTPSFRDSGKEDRPPEPRDTRGCAKGLLWPELTKKLPPNMLLLLLLMVALPLGLRCMVCAGADSGPGRGETREEGTDTRSGSGLTGEEFEERL